jgi:hypothetical protein
LRMPQLNASRATACALDNAAVGPSRQDAWTAVT